MKRAFVLTLEDGTECLATKNRRIIVATTEKEILDGPSRHTTDLDTVTVTEWLKAESE